MADDLVFVECRLFGNAGTDYDFSKQDFGEVRKRVKQLEERHKRLERNLDQHVMEKFDQYVAERFLWCVILRLNCDVLLAWKRRKRH